MAPQEGATADDEKASPGYPAVQRINVTYGSIPPQIWILASSFRFVRGGAGM